MGNSSARNLSIRAGLPRRRFLGLVLGALVFASVSLATLAKPKVVLISGEYEYATQLSLPAFANYLEQHHDFDCEVLVRGGGENIPGIEAVADADLLVLGIRRMTLPAEQLGRIRRHLEAGKPVIGFRTTSHAFENWKEWDPEVLGGNYHGHHKNHLVATAHVIPEVKNHPILAGVADAFVTGGSLYKAAPLAEGAIALMRGTVELDGAEPEPVAWTHKWNGANVFYTSLGDASDFARQPFMQLMVNATFWALRLPPPSEPARAIEDFPVQTVDVENFEAYAKHHRTLALDVRTPREYDAGHVKGALHLDYFSPDFKDKVAELDKDRPYAVYCKSGGRSGKTCKLMKEMGFKFIYDFSGSFDAWQAAGKPIEK